jgi:hypothetical protein
MGGVQFAIHQILYPSVLAVGSIFVSARFALEGSTMSMHMSVSSVSLTLDAGGRLDVTETGSIKYLTKYGLGSCYQIAHEKMRQKHTEELLQAPNMVQRLLSVIKEIDEEDGGYNSK